MRAIALFFTFYSVACGARCEFVGRGFTSNANESGEMVEVIFYTEDACRLYQERPGYAPRDFEKVHSVTLHNHKVSGDELRRVLAFPALRLLVLGVLPEGTDVEDHVLDLIRAQHLEGIELCKSRLTDSDLSFLPNLTRLKYLRIAGSNTLGYGEPHGLSDRAASWIVQLPELKVLEINGKSTLTDRFVENIASLPKLQNLRLYSDSLTDDSVSLLARKASLQKLSIASSGFTKNGGKALLAARSLQDVRVGSEEWHFRLEQSENKGLPAGDQKPSQPK